MGILAVLLLIFVAYKVMFTRTKGESAAGLLITVVVGLVILNVAIDLFSDWYASLSSFWQFLVMIGAVLAVILFVASRLFSKATRAHLSANLLHDLIWFLVTLPVRVLRSLFRFLFSGRERIRLQRSNDLDRNWIERGPHSR